MELEQPRKRNWFVTILKIVFVIAAILLVLFTVLANVGGSHDALKQSIENYITESTPYGASIGKLNNMSFFPNVIIDFENMEMGRAEDMGPTITVDHVQVMLSFWDVTASNGKVKVLNVENLDAFPGTLFRTPFTISRFAILETVDGPKLHGEGTIANKPYILSASLQSEGEGKGKRYSFGKERTFELSIADVVIRATAKGGPEAGLLLENIEITQGGKKIASGKADIVRNGRRIDAHATFKMEEHGSDIALTLTTELANNGHPTTTTGTIKSDAFFTADFSPGSGYDKVVTTLEQSFGYDETPANTKIKLEAATLHRGTSSKSYDGPLPLKTWHFDTSKLGQ